MLSKISLSYHKYNENKVKILLNDGSNQKSLTISLYLITNLWYMDIFEENKELLLGKIVHTWVDILEILKIYDKDFPKLELIVMPSNINGINKEFSPEVSGITQEIFLIGG